MDIDTVRTFNQLSGEQVAFEAGLDIIDGTDFHLFPAFFAKIDHPAIDRDGHVVVRAVAKLLQLIDHSECIIGHEAADIPQHEPAVAVDAVAAIDLRNVRQLVVVFAHVIRGYLADMRNVALVPPGQNLPWPAAPVTANDVLRDPASVARLVLNPAVPGKGNPTN